MAFFRRHEQLKAESKDKDVQPLPVEQTASRPRPDAVGTRVLKGFHVTEKSTRAAASPRGQYVFLVEANANKHNVKRAVEERFGVSVERVHVVNLPAKVRRRGTQTGWKAGRKKAIVTVKEGQRIEVK